MKEYETYKLEIQSKGKTVLMTETPAPSLLSVLHASLSTVAMLDDPDYLVITVQPTEKNKAKPDELVSRSFRPEAED